MHLKTTCPRCQSTYQVEPSLRGKRMRCPNPGCRHVFEVQDAETAPAAPAATPPAGQPPDSQQTGIVGGMVPILEARPAEVPPAPPATPVPPRPRPRKREPVVPAEPATPRTPTPLVNRDVEPPPSGPLEETPPSDQVLDALPDDEDDSLDALPDTGPGPAPAPSPPAGAGNEPGVPRSRKRGALVAVLLGLLLLAGGVTWGLLHDAGRPPPGAEAERSEKALKQYEKRQFADAAEQFRSLARDFPDSPSVARYRVLAELSSIREPIYKASDDLEGTRRNLERLTQFAAAHKGDALLAKHQADLHDSFKRLGEQFLGAARPGLDRKLFETARDVFTAAYRHTPGRALPAELTAELGKLEKLITARELRGTTLAFLKASLSKVSGEAVRKAREQVTQAGLHKDEEVQALLLRLYEAHRASVRYTPEKGPERKAAVAEEPAPGLLIAPRLKPHHGQAPPGRRPVLAVTRGMLYALAPDNGQVRWAARVSPEVTSLPLWLPPTALAPEQVLALSPDGLTLSALDANTGASRWSRRLTSPCRGRPALVGDRAFVPGAGGRVEEVEVHGGGLRGYYELGQPLTAGPVRQPGTDLLYFPAESDCVYALDVGKRACAAVLYSGHPAGSLLSAPVVLGAPVPLTADGKPTGPTGYLVLSQADGPKAMKLRVFALPASAGNAGPPQEIALPGRVAFPPHTDGDTLALVTDAGEFAVYGAEARADGPLFPQFRVQLAPAVGVKGEQARAQLAHAREGHFWVVAHGGLHALRAAFTREKGLHLKPPGPALVRVGSPLHAAQARGAGDEATLYLVTQPGEGQAGVATAVGAGGEVRWRRQLGLAPRGQPVAAGGRILVQDRGGSLFLFDPGKVEPQAGRAWVLAGEVVSEADAAEATAFESLAGEGKTYAVAGLSREAGPAVRVLALEGGKGPATPVEYRLEAPLQGTPALVGDRLVLPLANGNLSVWFLSGKEAERAPDWRSPKADPGAPGHVVGLGAREFVVTDGGRGLKRLAHGSAGWAPAAARELPNRIVAPPAVLPPRAGEGKARVCVADGGGVTLLRAEGLEVLRSWKLGGAVTSGPFARGAGVVCVVDRRKLVWLDPEKERPLWEASFRGDVVGRPELVDGVLAVADRSGEIRGLDPATGKPTGPGYKLRAGAAPAASPLPFGADRLFVPLTDGTVLLPPRSCLRNAPRK
jgi:hypothetical protein